MFEAVLSLGSNLGDKILSLKKAVKALENVPGVKIKKVSGYYETEPFGTPGSQEKYVNCCVFLETSLNSSQLLGVCLGIEASFGRERPYRFSPRTIDIDLIVYENEVSSEKHLILPHPRMSQRAFVLVPMMEIFPEGKFKEMNFKSYLEKLDTSGILKL